MSHKRDSCKQFRPRSDARWSGSTLFAFNIWISVKHGYDQKQLDIPLLLMDLSKVLR